MFYCILDDKSSTTKLSPLLNDDKKYVFDDEKKKIQELVGPSFHDQNSLVEKSVDTILPSNTDHVTMTSLSNNPIDSKENALNDGRKSWLHCAPSSPVHTVDLDNFDTVNRFTESVGTVPPLEQYSDSITTQSEYPDTIFGKSETKIRNVLPIVSSSTVIQQPSTVIQQSSPVVPSQKNIQIHTSKDNDKQRYPPSMSVKSFEDEYYSKNSLNLNNKNEDSLIKSANKQHKTVEKVVAKSKIDDGSLNKRESLSNNLFDPKSIKPENEQLMKEYEKLQVKKSV